MAMPHASSVRNSGGRYADKLGVATPFRGGFPMHILLHEVTFA